MEEKVTLKEVENLYKAKEYIKSDNLCKTIIKKDENNKIAWKFRALNTIGNIVNNKFEEKKLFKIIGYVNKSLQDTDEEKELLIKDYIKEFKDIKVKIHKEIEELVKDIITEIEYRELCEKCIIEITVLSILYALDGDKKYLEDILEATLVYRNMYKSNDKKIRFALKESDFKRYKDIIEDTNKKLKKLDSSYKIKNPPKDYESYVKDVMGGCYIATCVYGGYDKEEVVKLREFRDEVLEKYVLGRCFIKIYYKFSPIIARRIKRNSFISKKIKSILDKFIKYIF